MAILPANPVFLFAGVTAMTVAVGTVVYFEVVKPAQAPKSAPTTAAIEAPSASDPANAALVQPAAPMTPGAATPKATDASAPQAELAVLPQSEVPPEMDATPKPPSIDEVRLASDGIFVVAGRAQPGSRVAVLLDGLENTETQTGAEGAFAAVTIVMPSPNPQLLTVVQRGPDGDLLGEDEIVLAPTPAPAPAVKAPEAVAQAEATAVAPQDEVADAEAQAVPEVAPETVPEEAPAVADATPKPAPQPQAEPEPVAEPTTVAEAEPAPTPSAAPTPAAPAPAAPTPAEPAPTAQAPAILKADAQGVELISGGESPEVMDNVAIDTISYSDIGEVQLSGRSTSAAETVRIYLDNAAVVELVVDDRGRWRGDVPNVDQGIYTLRVDEVSAQGDVVSRIETPFKREDPQELAQAGGPQAAPVKAITVQTGATLWAIARDRYGEGTLYVRVFEANRDSIRDADLIYPGQVFKLPD